MSTCSIATTSSASRSTVTRRLPANRNQFAGDPGRVAAVPGVRRGCGVNAVVTGDQSMSTIAIAGYQPKPKKT
jgi:hypothetical protein